MEALAYKCCCDLLRAVSTLTSSSCAKAIKLACSGDAQHWLQTQHAAQPSDIQAHKRDCNDLTFIFVGKATALGTAQPAQKAHTEGSMPHDVAEQAEPSSKQSGPHIHLEHSVAHDTEEDAEASSIHPVTKKRRLVPARTSDQAARKPRGGKSKQQAVEDVCNEDGEMSGVPQGAIDLDAVHSKGQHQRQVVEDDDIVMTADTSHEHTISRPLSSENAALAPSDAAVMDNGPSRTSVSVLDRIAALDSILSQVPKPAQSVDAAAAPDHSVAVKPKVKMSLLDAMVADDDVDYGGQHSSTQHGHLSSMSSTADPAMGAARLHHDAASLVAPAQSLEQPHGTAPGIHSVQDAPPHKPVECASSNVAASLIANPKKGSLRERMKALGMTNKQQ